MLSLKIVKPSFMKILDKIRNSKNQKNLIKILLILNFFIKKMKNKLLINIPK